MKIGDWLDERTGHRALLKSALDEPVEGGARWAYVFGSALTLSLVVQAVTGWLLMSAYAPSATTAWASVHNITFTLRSGWLIRGLHHFGAQAMVVLLILHLGQTAIFGAYRKPREVNWFFGLGLLGVTLGFALTGYLLPWDQKGYWATRVATNIAGTVPVMGAWLQRMLVGGSEYGHLTLTRFYTLHVGILPAVTALLVVGHIALFRKHGVTPGPRADRKKIDRFFPKQVGMDLLVAMLVLGVIFALAMREHGAPLDAPADPSSDYPARPEWYFLSLFEMLKHFEGSLEPVGAIGIPSLIIGYLVALPFLDKTKPETPLSKRLILLSPLALIFAGAVGLTALSMSKDAGDMAFQKARVTASERAERAVALAKDGVPPEGALAMMRSDPLTRGPELFASQCASCHVRGDLGPKKGEETAPDLTGFGSKAWVLSILENPDSDDRFGKTPFKGMMPSLVHPPKDPEAASYFTAMKKEDQDAIADFLAAEARGGGAADMPGEKLVKQRCTSCHRLDGKTDDEDSLAPELRGWASTKWIRAQIEAPGSGATYPKGAVAEDLKGHMPGFGDKLSARDIDLLATWLTNEPAKK